MHIDILQLKSEIFGMPNLRAVACGLGGRTIRWRGTSFTVWKVPPRRVKTRCVRSKQKKFGDVRLGVAIYYLLGRIGKTSLLDVGALSSRHSLSLIQEAGRRMKHDGITPIRLGFCCVKGTTRTLPPFLPTSQTCSHEPVILSS